MDSNDVMVVRYEHAQAIENLDFHRAEVLGQRLEMLKGTKMQTQTRDLRSGRTVQHRYRPSLTEQRVCILEVREAQRLECESERSYIEVQFIEKREALLAQQAAELEHIEDLCAREIERVDMRLVPEAEQLTLDAKISAREHRYAEARIRIAAAANVKARVIEDRENDVYAAFERRRTHLVNQHARQLELLKGSVDESIKRLHHRFDHQISVLDKQLQVNKIRRKGRPKRKQSNMTMTRRSAPLDMSLLVRCCTI